MSSHAHLPKFVVAQRTVSYQVSDLLSDMSSDEMSSLSLRDLLRIVNELVVVEFGSTDYVTYTDEDGKDLASKAFLEAYSALPHNHTITTQG